MTQRLALLYRRYPSLPLILLTLVSVLSLGARVAWLGDPCRSPCTTALDHVLIFDETYYVNAARVIAGLRAPPGAPYAGAPAGVDPNSEHPQLAKLIIAGSIEAFGDGPFAWRLGSLVLGTLAILGLYVLVRAGGGGSWLALGAATLMAFDNLQLVHGRIGTLDVYALAAMIWGAALYLRGRPIAGGVVIGVGACAKLVAPYALLALAVFEALRWVTRQTDARRSLLRWLESALSAAAVFFALLALMDRIAPPYDPATGKRITGGPFAHLGHMLSYAAKETSPHGPKGIASYPWQWLVDYKPITYLYIDPAHPGHGLYHVHPATHFLGAISPPIMLLALPALVLAAHRIMRTPSELELLGLAWFIGTFVPFELLSLLLQRTSYLYYMVIVMPGIYIVVTALLARLRPRWWLAGGWAVCVVIAAVLMYPLTPLP